MRTTESSPTETQTANRDFVISRVFAAPRDRVFAAWTERDQIAQWFGPKGVSIVHCTNDLRPGGTMHYGMRTPDGAVMWGKWIYREIAAPDRLVFIVSFSDEAGGVTRHPMSAGWPLETLSTVEFVEHGAATEVIVRWSAHNATELEQETFNAAHGSMQQGWSGTFDQFAAYLARA